MSGDIAHGCAVVADALAWTASTGQAYPQSELLLIDAELLALAGDVPPPPTRAEPPSMWHSTRNQRDRARVTAAGLGAPVWAQGTIAERPFDHDRQNTACPRLGREL